jgi:hypothetical protein
LETLDRVLSVVASGVWLRSPERGGGSFDRKVTRGHDYIATVRRRRTRAHDQVADRCDHLNWLGDAALDGWIATATKLLERVAGQRENGTLDAAAALGSPVLKHEPLPPAADEGVNALICAAVCLFEWRWKKSLRRCWSKVKLGSLFPPRYSL